MDTTCCLLDTPIAQLALVGDGHAVTGLYLPPHRHVDDPGAGLERDDTAFPEARAQLLEYMAGTRRSFQLELRPPGTPFQRAVWDALAEIPYGQTRTYGQLAASAGAPGAFRAVGAAIGRNPISIVVPCHRVVGSNGTLTGYAGGLERKAALLRLERDVCAGVLALV